MQPVDDRQRERRRLAGAGLREADQSRPCSASGIACCWIGVGCVYPASRDRREDALWKPEGLEPDGLVGGGGCSVPAPCSIASYLGMRGAKAIRGPAVVYLTLRVG